MPRLAWALGAVCLIAVVVVLALKRTSPSSAPPQTSGTPAPLATDLPMDDLVRALDGEPGHRREALVLLGARGEAALPAVARLVALLGDADALTPWLAAEALGQIGPAVAPQAEPALMAAHAANRDAVFRFAVERALAKTGGWSRFRHEMPEEITFLERPYLRVVEEAERRVWLKGDDVAVAERCWRQTVDHVRRLRSDRLARLGEQALAHAAHAGPYRNFAFEAEWSPPFLVCASDATERSAPVEASRLKEMRKRPLAELEREPRRFDALLADTAEVVQAVYAKLQRERGSELGLRPLEAEFGGRPDYAKSVRSFADGFPIVFWVWTSPKALDEAARILKVHWSSAAETLCLLPMDASPVQVAALDEAGRIDPERAGFAACVTLLAAWRRQANRWRHGSHDAMWDPLWIGLSAEHAGWARDKNRALQFTGDSRLFRAELGVYVEAAREMRLAGPPWMPLAEFLRIKGYTDSADWVRKQGINPWLGRSLLRGQSFALVRWLSTSTDTRHRAALTAGLQALLRDEPSEPEVRRALGVENDDDWAPIDAAFRDWLRAQTAADAPEEAAPGGTPR